MREAKPVPTAGIMTPKSTPDFDEAKRRWDQVRNEIEEALLGTPEEGTFVKHPIFGKLGPVHFLELIDAHLEYHEKRFPIKDR